MGKGEDEEKDANWFPWHTKTPESSVAAAKHW